LVAASFSARAAWAKQNTGAGFSQPEPSRGAMPMKSLRILPTNELPPPGRAKASPNSAAGILSTQFARRILRRRTGGNISRATFYRWVRSGRVSSIRLGFRIYVPLPALDDFIRKCLSGE
jgi:hypothetical protein